MEIQVPYYNYTISEILPNGNETEVKNFDKYLPRTWLNSNRTIVKSYCQMLVNFTDVHELTKVFVIRNHGILKQKNFAPKEYHGD